MAVSGAPVLFLATWYPNRWDPWLGIFIERHALALSNHRPVLCLYVMPAPVAEVEYHVQSKGALTSLNVYYPAVQSRIPVYSSVLKLCKRIRYTVGGYRSICKTAGISKPGSTVLQVIGPMAWLGIYLRLIQGVPLYWFEHWNGYLAQDGRYRGLFLKCTGFVLSRVHSGLAAVSGLLADALRKHGLGDQIEVIPNIVDDGFYAQSVIDQKVEKPFRLAHISNYVSNKQADKILDAVLILMSERDDFVFEFVGRDLPGKLVLKARVGELPSFSERIRFVPVMAAEAMPAYMRGLTGLVMYSAWETQCVVVLEAWASGIPVICTSDMGVWEHAHAGNSIVADADHVDSLVAAIRSLLDERSRFDAQVISEDGLAYQSGRIGAALESWLIKGGL